MSRFRINRGGFIRKSAGAATLGLAACSGGAAVGGSPVPSSPGSGSGTGTTLPTASPAAGTTAAPVATATPGASATATPAASFPSASVSSGTRGPNSLPDSSKPAGTANAALPFEYVVVVMMENHSFDNYFGMLPLRGQPLADGFTFDSNGKPMNKNPLDGGYQYAFHLQGTCAPYGVSQDWDNTHKQVNDGAMDGFAATCNEAMGYWDESDLPFYYSLAKTFCLGNRSFCSTQGQTYPNRRYLYAATSSGNISTSTSSFSMAAPANGTLMDVMTKYGVTWTNYFTDLPATVIIPQNLENHPTNYQPITQFFTDCAAGLLPNVSFVDPDFDAVGTVGSDLFSYLQEIPNPPAAIAAALTKYKEDGASLGQSEENPQDIAIGEAFVSRVVNAVMNGPLWSKTLLIWTYDEHGGYYDHVVPLGAPEPDSIPPEISSTDYQAAFNVTGVRVPTVVVSPWTRPNAVSNVPHDHTSIIATIAAKWNLPALTYRDAQANTLFDYVNFNATPFLTPPTLAAPALPEDVSGGTGVPPPPPPLTPPQLKTTRKTTQKTTLNVR
jgi:phospholipase C